MVGVWRWGAGRLLGEVIFVSIPEGGRPVGEGVFEFVELVTSE